MARLSKKARERGPRFVMGQKEMERDIRTSKEKPRLKPEKEK